MRYVVAGTAGHIDHGKTELVRALTGTNPDRLREEQERGITIDIGFAHLELPGARIAFVDVPGHERFVKNMLAGACGIDLVVLVVAADESIKPQTREHFDICRLLGVASGLVALTKADLVDKEILEIARLETREFIRGSFLAEAPVIAVSARTGEGLEELRVALRAAALSCPVRSAGGVARLPVDRSFSVHGFGTVVTGTLVSGALREGQEVEVLPGGRRGRIRGIEVHGQQVKEALAGQRTAVNVQGVATEEIRRGQVLAAPGGIVASRMLDAWLTVLPDSPVPVKDLARVRFHAGTSELLGRVRTLEGPEIQPGCSGPAQLRLESGCVAAPGDRFIVRRYSPARTIAGGEVLDVLPRKHRRGEPGLIDGLRRLGSAGTRDRATIFIGQAGERGIPLPELAARCGAAPEEVREVAAALSGAGAIRVLPAEPPRAVCVEALSNLGERCQELLAGFHAREPLKAGLPREELRVRLLPGGPVEVFRAVLEDLSASGSVRLTRDVVALAAHRIELTPEERTLRESIEKDLLEAGLDPPPVERLLPSDDRARISAEKLLHLMLKEGLLHRLPDGRFLHNSVLGDLRDKLRQFRRRSEMIDIASFKDLAGVTRKNAIPLLELLDAERVTLRRGNDRLILPEV